MPANKYRDLDYIRNVYIEAKSRSQAERQHFERDWFRNVLFYIGIQWVTYSPTKSRWIPMNLKRWVPRPVTNKFATHANTIMQVLSAKAPEAVWRGSTDSPEDQAAAEIANRNFDVILDEAEAPVARDLVASWVTLTGNAFIHSYYDNAIEAGTSFVQSLQCQQCREVFSPDELLATGGNCPECGGATSAAIDETGAAIGEEMPRGRNRCEVFSPFEIFLDMEARSFEEVQEILVRRRYPIEKVRSMWGSEVEPDTEGGGDTRGGYGLNLLRAIAYAGSTGHLTQFAAGRSAEHSQGVTVDYLWKRPSEKFPEGLVAIFCNDEMKNKGDLTLPYRDRKGEPVFPWRHAIFDRVPGRLWGKTPLDDIAPKQEQRNKLESLIQLIITRSANPVWLKPKGIGVVQITGEPGQEIEGNWASDPRMMPQRIPGENVPTSVIAWLEKIDNDMEELAGTYEVLKGSAPPGVTAGTALRLLLERAVTRYTPVVGRLEYVWEQVYRDQMIIFQQFGTEERVAAIQGPGKTWEMQRFSAADLAGSVDVSVEAGSAMPKNSVGVQALVQDLAGMAVINPAEPETQYKILQEFGMTKLLGTTDSNIKQAQREQWYFVHEGKLPKVDPVIDNHLVHVLAHKEWALTSDFEALDPVIQAIWKQHIVEHQIAMMPVMPAAPVGDEKGGPFPNESASSSRRGNGSGGPPTPPGMPGVPPSSPTGMDEQMPPMFPGAI